MTMVRTRSWLPAGLMVSTMLIPVSALAASPALNALPTGGVVAAGQASVAVNGAQMTVTQTSDKAILNWRGFDIGAQAGVTFVQPGASAIALNRVTSSDPSQILGSLRSNGQLVLINPAGVVFGGGSTVNVGGLVASTLNLADKDFLSGNLRFERSGKAGAIDNQGTLQAHDGGYIALVAPQIRNGGLIEARFGSVALAAGDVVTLSVSGQGLLGVTLDPATVQAQIDAGGVIRAPGGKVLLTAQAANALYGGAINADGVIEADSLSGTAGAVALLASSDLDISGATISALGGRLETSAKGRVTLGGAKVTAADWLVDPDDLTIDTSAAATIVAALASGNVTLQTTSGAASFTGVGAVGTTAAGVGDIIVAAPLSWSSNQTLTLDAYHGVTVNAAITATGATAGLTIMTNDGGTGGRFTVAAGSPVTLSGASAALTINSHLYTLITSAAGINSVSSVSDVTKYYALDADLDISGAPHTGLNSPAHAFEGLGHVITGLVRVAGTPNAGLFITLGSNTTVENLTLSNVSVTSSSSNVGALVGTGNGTVYNVSATGTVTGGAAQASVGGLIGVNVGTVVASHAAVAVNGSGTGTGGLIGLSQGDVTDSYATGAVNGGAGLDIGGLIGFSKGATVLNSYATGAVTGAAGASSVGGLIGLNQSRTTGGVVTPAFITNSYATGAVTVLGSSTATVGVGGLIGFNLVATITGSYATGAVSAGAGATKIGGLVGDNEAGVTAGTAYASPISSSYATGTVTGGAGASRIGGLVGDNLGSITSSYATGAVSGGAGATEIGGLAGGNREVVTSGQALIGSIVTSYATGQVSAAGDNGAYGIGGLVGRNYSSSISGSHATGSVVVSGSAIQVGGLVGLNDTGTVAPVNALATITTSYATGAVSVGGANASAIGGLVGLNDGDLSLGYATGAVSAGSAAQSVGGLVGEDAQGRSIANSYATGAVTAGAGATGVGGLVGALDSANPGSTGTVSSSYATGAVSGGSGAASLGGLVGFAGPSATAQVTASYWDSTTTGQSASAGGGTGLTTLQWLTNGPAATADAAWNLGSTWVAGYPYPVLKALPYIVISGASSTTYGTALSAGGGVTSILDQDGADASGRVNASGLIWFASGSLNAGTYRDGGSGATAPGTQMAYGGMVTVNPLAVSLTGGRTYDADTDAAAAILAFANNLDGANLTLTGTGVLSSPHAGSASLTSTGGALTGLSLGGSAAGNYTLVGGTGVVAVAKAPLTITAPDVTITAGDSLSSLVPRFTGLLASDGASVVQGLTLVSTGQPGVPGVYAITPQGGTAQDYAITYAAGVLTVQPGSTVTPPPVITPPPPIITPPPITTPPAQAQTGTFLSDLTPSNTSSIRLPPPSSPSPNLATEPSSQGATTVGSFMTVDGIKTGGVLMTASDPIGGMGPDELSGASAGGAN
jgi:filamentous hemagglutinin family protein